MKEEDLFAVNIFTLGSTIPFCSVKRYREGCKGPTARRLKIFKFVRYEIIFILARNSLFALFEKSFSIGFFPVLLTKNLLTGITEL